MPSTPWDSRCARSLSETVLLTSHRASSVSQPSEASGWFSFNCFLEQVAQPVEQLALQRVLGRSHGAGRIAAQLLGHRSPVGLHDKFAQYAGVLVLPGQDVQQRWPTGTG